MFETKIKVTDIIIVFSVITLAAVLLVSNILCFTDPGDSFIVECASDGILGEYSLKNDGEYYFAASGYSLTVMVEDGRLWVSTSDCPGGDCCLFGEIAEKGESIICVPAGLIIRITGGDSDAIAG